MQTKLPDMDKSTFHECNSMRLLIVRQEITDPSLKSLLSKITWDEKGKSDAEL